MNKSERKKRDDPKKRSKKEQKELEAHVYQKQGGKCFCGCGRGINEFHHAYFGIDKDDRFIVGIAQHPCHYAIHHGKDMDLKRKLITSSEIQAVVNWESFNGSI